MAAKPVSPRPLADLLFGAFYSAAIGGSIIGLFFLVLDVATREPLFTPSLLGSVLFMGAAPDASVEIDLTAVSLYTILHLVTFAVIGLVGSAVYQRARRRGLPAGILTFLAVFVAAEGGILLASATVMPGITEILGLASITAGNVLAGLGMTLFLRWAYEKTAGLEPRAAGSGGDGSNAASLGAAGAS